MNILVTLDSNYVFPLTVLLKSLMITNSESEFDIYVAHSSLTEEDFEKIKSAADLSRTRIHQILVSAGILENAPVLKRITKETYYRLLMMDYLPQNVDRILYIDPDTVVLRDISPLYNIDFKGRTIAAAGHTKLFIEDLNHLRFRTGKGTSEEWNKINGIKTSGFLSKTIHYHEAHTMSDWTVDSKATCKAEGEQSRYCTYDCGYTETATIPVAAHAMGNWYTAKNPTCTAKGQSKRDCTYGCGTSETKDISATGHKDGNPYDGYCDICGAETDAVENCSCNCHKDGFMGFIWKIISFFQKLFKTNEQCACGIAHY